MQLTYNSNFGDCSSNLRVLALNASCLIYPPCYHRGALRGTPGSACPQPEPNATELPSCAHISARAAQRWRRRLWWRGEEGARRPGSEGPVLRHVGTSFAAPPAASCASSFTCLSFTCRPGAALGAACVCWAWVPLEDDACHDEHAVDRTSSRIRLASGSPRAAAYCFCP